MSYNEQNLVAFVIFAVLVALMYRDKPQNASIIIIAAVAYVFLSGRLPVSLEVFR